MVGRITELRAHRAEPQFTTAAGASAAGAGAGAGAGEGGPPAPANRTGLGDDPAFRPG
ncbi:hypothetical protein ACFWXO_24615 [Kitasatospora sp. NPDC059088]|uniref:hypothetical protein n=1 Tax=Kitasatospora sp. NPDC059088 TaxID=3346722 RepID=UPI0036CCC62B